jgi:DNA polymerase-3 subunit delta
MELTAVKEFVNKNQKRAYFLYAEDEQLLFQIRDLLRKRVIGDDNSMSHIKLDANRCTPLDLENALNTYSMFQEDILVELSNCNFMESSTQHAMKEIIEEYLKNPREDLYFFATYKYENDLSKKNSYLDGLKKKINALSFIESIDSLKQKGMVSLIEDLFVKQNVQVSKNIPVFIGEVFRGNSLQLEKEIEKLIAYTDGGEIRKEDVLAIMEVSDERHVMNLLDLIFTERGLGRNIKEILNLINDLLYRGEKPEMIIGLVGSRLRMLFKVKILHDRSASSQEIMKHLRTGSAWYADRISKVSGSLSFKEYNKLFHVLLEHEYMLKTTSVESSALLEMLIISMVNSRDVK